MINDKLIELINMQADEQIEAYLRGRMSETEEQLFMAKLKKDPKLRERAVAMARLIKGLKEVGAEQDKAVTDALLASSASSVSRATRRATAAETVPTAERTDKSAASVNKKVLLARWLSVAASLVVIVWLGMSYSNYRHVTGLGEEYGNMFETSAPVRGAQAGDADTKLDKLIADVKSGENIDTAIHDLSLYWELSRMGTFNDYTNRSADIGWYLAISHLKDNDETSACRVLEELIATTEEGTAIRAKAEELLEMI